MACFLPTNEALIELARLTGREPKDTALTQLFDALVLRGHLTPWLPDSVGVDPLEQGQEDRGQVGEELTNER